MTENVKVSTVSKFRIVQASEACLQSLMRIFLGIRTDEITKMKKEYQSIIIDLERFIL